jgi:hypothetical protein
VGSEYDLQGILLVCVKPPVMDEAWFFGIIEIILMFSSFWDNKAGNRPAAV